MEYLFISVAILVRELQEVVTEVGRDGHLMNAFRSADVFIVQMPIQG